MAQVNKKRSDAVGQIDDILTVMVQLGIPTGAADPTPVASGEEGASDNALLFYNTTIGELRACVAGVWGEALPLGNYYTKAEADGLLADKVDVSAGNQPDGYAKLDGTGLIGSAQLPSYVDDVLEVANTAALPAVGETGKIYVTLDTNFEYRWSGSTYIRIVASPGSTDEVPEGPSGNFLYITAARVLAVILAGLSLGSSAAVTSADSILVAIGKLQAQITALLKVPTGGATGTILVKNSATTGDYSWGLYHAASETDPGVTALATVAEAVAGTNDTKAMTALKVISAILDQRKNVRYGINPVSLNEVSVLMENAGNVTSSIVSNLSGLKLKTGYAGTYPVGAQTYPFAYAANDVVVITYTFSDANNLRGNLKLICRDS